MRTELPHFPFASLDNLTTQTQSHTVSMRENTTYAVEFSVELSLNLLLKQKKSVDWSTMANCFFFLLRKVSK